LTAFCSKGSQARKPPIFGVDAKMAVFAVLRTTLSGQRNGAASTKLATAFIVKVGTMLKRKRDDRKRVRKALIVELAVVCGCHS